LHFFLLIPCFVPGLILIAKITILFARGQIYSLLLSKKGTNLVRDHWRNMA
jgi:hypothetical protein